MKIRKLVIEDYSNFSWEAIQAAWREIIEDAQKRTGASDEEMALAISLSASFWMDTNGFVEPRRNDE